MPLFVIHALDKPGALPLRMETRPAHLDYVKSLGAAVKLAGPLLDEAGESIRGSLFIYEAPDRAALDAILAADPYVKVDLFAAVSVHPFKALIGAPLT